jgi:hypothetical protein
MSDYTGRPAKRIKVNHDKFVVEDLTASEIDIGVGSADVMQVGNLAATDMSAVALTMSGTGLRHGYEFPPEVGFAGQVLTVVSDSNPAEVDWADLDIPEPYVLPSTIAVDNIDVAGYVNVSGAVNTLGLSIGSGAVDYAFPTARGTANQLMAMNTAEDELEFVDPYVLPANIAVNNIDATGQVTAAGVDTLGLIIGASASDYAFPTAAGTPSQVLSMNSTSDALEFKDPSGGSDQSLNTTDSVQFEGLTLNSGLYAFTFPTDRGQEGNVLMETTNGAVEWQIPFQVDQDVNTDSTPTFEEVTIGTGFTLASSSQNTIITHPELDSSLSLTNGALRWTRASGSHTGRPSTISCEKSRDTIASPDAMGNGNLIGTFMHRAYLDANFTATCMQISTEATQSHDSNSAGTRCKIQTCDDNNKFPRTQIQLDTDGVTINDAGNSINFPSTRGTDKQILQTDALGVLGWVGIPNNSQFINMESGNSITGTNETNLFNPSVGVGSMTWEDKVGSAKTYNMGGVLTHAANAVLTIRLYYGSTAMLTWPITFSALTPTNIDYKMTIRHVVKTGNNHVFVCTFMIGETTTPSMNLTVSSVLSTGSFLHFMTGEWGGISNEFGQELFTITHDNLVY